MLGSLAHTGEIDLLLSIIVLGLRVEVLEGRCHIRECGVLWRRRSEDSCFANIAVESMSLDEQVLCVEIEMSHAKTCGFGGNDFTFEPASLLAHIALLSYMDHGTASHVNTLRYR